MQILVLVNYVVSVLCVVLAKERFDGHRVLNIVPRMASDVDEIVQMEDQFNLDFWHLPRNLNDGFHVRVPPQNLDSFLDRLRQLNADVSVWIDDVQRLVEEEEKQSKKRSVYPFDYMENYYNFSDIDVYLKDLASHPNIHLSTLKYRTFENRMIPVVKITHPTATPSQSIFIDCGIHAREWISPSFCLHVINMLLYETEDEMLRKYNWHIVPVLNPDGYQYSHTTDRMWRKNRRDNTSDCSGVDLNRNFGYEFNANIGGSVYNCSNIYVGTGPFSEPESLGLKAYIEENKNENFLAYLTVHSYGQMWLYPWGYTTEPPADKADLENAAISATNALQSHTNTIKYKVGSSSTVLYAAAGGSDDWAKGDAGIKYSYTLELRDRGRYAFSLPESQIIDTVTETWKGVKALASYINSQKQI